MSTTLPSQLLGSVASAAGSGLDTAGQLVADAGHLVADATESLGDIAGAAIDVGGSAAGVIADSTVRGARKAWIVAPGVVGRQASPSSRGFGRGRHRGLFRPQPSPPAVRQRSHRRRRPPGPSWGERGRLSGRSATHRHRSPTATDHNQSSFSGTTRTPAPSEDERVVPRLGSVATHDRDRRCAAHHDLTVRVCNSEVRSTPTRSPSW